VDLLTVREAAAMLRVSQVTLRRYVASGKLPAVRVGRNVRIERAAAVEFVVPTAPGATATAEPGSELPSEAKLFTRDSPFWELVGFIEDDGPTDMSSDKYKYLAEAYADLHEE